MIKGKENIVWITSYPKSGNTWMRVFLSNIFNKKEEPVNINELIKIPNSSSRLLLDRYLGIESSDLSDEEINILRPEAFRYISHNSNENQYFKVHDAWTKNKRDEPIFPSDVTKRVIYIIRHPIDVAISYSFHNSTKIEEAISLLNDLNHNLCSKKGKLYFQLNQTILSWSEHIRSWLDHSNLPISIIKYEDMLNYPHDTFGRVLDDLEISHSRFELNKAIMDSSFEKLQKQEDLTGFIEKPINSRSRFFRNGSNNYWKSEPLDQNLIKDFESVNHEMMSRFDYFLR